MKGYLSTVPGGPDSLQMTDVDRPEPRAGELLIKVAAIGVNRVDAMQRSGIYPPPAGTSDILGVECAGEVIAHGPGAEAGPAIGTRVIALVPAGAYAEYVAVHHTHVVETPEGWSDVLAASVIETFCTAHETVFQLGQLKAGEIALIHAAGSAVGSTAIQMARMRGAMVISTAGSDEKVAAGLKIGAHHVINYKTSDFAEEVLRLYPEGIDFIEDFVGPAYFAQHLRILRWLGRISMVGLLSSGEANTSTAPIIGKRLTINGFTLRPTPTEPKTDIVARFRDEWMPELVAERIKPVIYAELPFARADECHRILEENRNFGKIVMTL
jgi:putative PIG3 family NAD(P)H quinone oxidoreductase